MSATTSCWAPRNDETLRHCKRIEALKLIKGQFQGRLLKVQN